MELEKMDQTEMAEYVGRVGLDLSLALPGYSQRANECLAARLSSRAEGDASAFMSATALLQRIVMDKRGALDGLAGIFLDANELEMNPYELVSGENGLYRSLNPNSRVLLLQKNEKSFASLESKAVREAAGLDEFGAIGDVHRLRLITPDDESSLYVVDFVEKNLELAPDIAFDQALALKQKSNGYRCWHLKVMYGGQKMEVQVRTLQDHLVAECGSASHDMYKQQRMVSPN